MISLYEKLGGANAVLGVVVRLYDKILSDENLAPFFVGIDIEKLRRSQHAFVSMAVGGPHNYSGRTLVEVHARLVKDGLTDFHFNLVLFHLEAVMQELRLPEEYIEEAVAVVESVRENVLGRANG